MNAQKALFDPGPADGDLTERQRKVYDAIGPEGITASQAGLLLHNHPPGVLGCKFCRGDGNGVLQALRRRGLVKRRKTGIWQLVRQPPQPIGELPADF